MTKIYFAGSITGGRDDIKLYGQIIDYLRKYGEVLTEHIGDKELSALGETNLSDSKIYVRDTNRLDMADVLVAEVTTPSLGVGFEIGKALERNEWINGSDRKKILCLYRPSDGKRLSAMIAGCEGITVESYLDIEGAKNSIDKFFGKR